MPHTLQVVRDEVLVLQLQASQIQLGPEAGAEGGGGSSPGSDIYLLSSCILVKAEFVIFTSRF